MNPILVHTTFGPEPLGLFFYIKPFCAHTFANHLDPKKPWPMELLFWTICCFMSCFLGHGPCRIRCVVLWCVGAVCDFRGCVQNLGAPPNSPPPDPLSRLPPPLRRTAQKFALFYPRPPLFSFFLPLLGVVSWNFGGVIEGRDPQMCMFGLSGCRVKPRWLLELGCCLCCLCLLILLFAAAIVRRPVNPPPLVSDLPKC